MNRRMSLVGCVALAWFFTACSGTSTGSALPLSDDPMAAAHDGAAGDGGAPELGTAVPGSDGTTPAPGPTAPTEVVPSPGNTAGVLDATFGSGGKLVVTTPVLAGFAAITLDGRIVAGATPSTDFGIDRYLDTGAVDTSFGAAGHVTTDIGGNGDALVTSAFQPDGRMVVGGECSNSVREMFCLVRYETNGVLDPSFDSDGKLMTYIPYDGGVNAIAMHPDGRIVALGTLDVALIGTNDIWAVTRYTTSGALDTTFDGDGIATIDYAGYAGLPRAALVRPNGTTLVAGLLSANATPSATRMAIFGMTSSGALDASFGSGGRVIVQLGSQANEARAMALQTDGKIIVVGNNADAGGGGIVRLNGNGSIDTTYGTGGSVQDLPDAQWIAASVQPDGKLLVAGTATTGASHDFIVARVLPGGVPDRSFGKSGYVRTDFAGGHDDLDHMQVTAGGKLLVVGHDPVTKRVLAAQYAL